MADPREPKTATFRKVRAGWYTHAVVTFEDIMADIRAGKPEHERRKEAYIDVSRRDQDGDWLVSTRGGDESGDVFALKPYSLFRQVVRSFEQAKRYATVLKAYLYEKGEHPDYILKVFREEDDAAHRAKIESIVGKPYDVWEAEMLGKVG